MSDLTEEDKASLQSKLGGSSEAPDAAPAGGSPRPAGGTTADTWSAPSKGESAHARREEEERKDREEGSWMDKLRAVHGMAQSGGLQGPAAFVAAHGGIPGLVEPVTPPRAPSPPPIPGVPHETAGAITPAMAAQMNAAPVPAPAPPPPNNQMLAQLAMGGGGGAPAAAPAAKREPYDPSIKQNLNEAGELRKDAASDQAAGLESTHAAQKEVSDATAQFDKDANDKDVSRRAAREAALAKDESAWKQAMAQNAKMKLEDPESHMGFGSKLWMAVSLAAGQFGQGLLHQSGPTAAAKIWGDRLERDTEAQKEAIAQGKGAVNDLHDVYKANLDRTGDLEKAAILTRAQGKQAFVDGLQSKLLTANDPNVAAEGKKAMADAAESVARDNEAYTKLSDEHAKTQWEMRDKPKAGAGAGTDPRKELIARARHLRDEAMGRGHEMDPMEAMRQAQYEETMLDPLAGKPLAPGAKQDKEGPINPRVEAAAAAGDVTPGYGQDAYDRNAPNWARSSEALNEQQKLAVAARAAIKVIGGREPPAGREGDEAAIHSMVGPRPDAQAVASFLARTRHLVGGQGGAPAPAPGGITGFQESR